MLNHRDDLLVANTGLGSGDLVDLRNNPLNTISLNTHIPALRSRGVEVPFGALKPAVAEKEQDIPNEMMESLEIEEARGRRFYFSQADGGEKGRD